MKMSYKKGMEDVQDEVWHLCKVLQELEKAVSPSYLIRLLKGHVRLGLHHTSHMEIEGFGALKEKDSDRLRCLIRYLVEEDFLERISPKMGSMILTSKGKAYLKEPYPLILYPRQLSQNRFEKEIYLRLKALRKEVAREEGCPAYIIFSDFTLDELSLVQPVSLEQLGEIPGMGDQRINRYGAKILEIVLEIREKQRQDRKQRLSNLILRPSFREVKSLFETGMEVSEIARRRKVKESTIRQMLMDLHEASEIDLTHWIEREVSPESLKKGKEYFMEREEVRLSQAFKELGLAYDTLKLCRLYVSRMSRCEEVWDFTYDNEYDFKDPKHT